jgi:hypothetical protein
MGRELKRVVLDFDWPIDKVWQGFINPHYSKQHSCGECDGTGYTTARNRLIDLVSLLMLSGDDARRGKCHPYLREAPLYRTRGKTCGGDMAAFTGALVGRAPSFLGHDTVDNWSAQEKILSAAGMPENWGICTACDGEGNIWDSPEDKVAAEAWQRIEPPAGDGYQIWETVSEGSPISPVFATAEELARHMAGTRWGADHGSSYETWMRFITGPGWAPSMVMDHDGLRTGPDAVIAKGE